MRSWKKVIAAGLTAVLSMNIVNVTFGKEGEYIYADPFETPNLTGVWRTDIITVAESQMGYTEAKSDRKKVDMEKATRKPYRRTS